jgi:hypothetical protein
METKTMKTRNLPLLQPQKRRHSGPPPLRSSSSSYFLVASACFAALLMLRSDPAAAAVSSVESLSSSSSSSSSGNLLRRVISANETMYRADALFQAHEDEENEEDVEREHAELRAYAGQLQQRLLKSLQRSDPFKLRGFLWDDYTVGGIKQLSDLKRRKGMKGGKLSASGQLQGIAGLSGGEGKWWCDTPASTGKGGGGGKASSKSGGKGKGGKGGGSSGSSKSMKGKGGKDGGSKSKKGSKGGGKGGNSSKGKKGSKGGNGKGGKRERPFQRYFEWVLSRPPPPST